LIKEGKMAGAHRVKKDWPTGLIELAPVSFPAKNLRKSNEAIAGKKEGYLIYEQNGYEPVI
jgi:hypothetical protein